MSVALPISAPEPSVTALRAITGPGLRDVIAERVQQIDRDGFGPKHDAVLSPAQVLIASEAALKEGRDWLTGELIDLDCAREALVRAATNIWAAIDRIDAEALTPIEVVT